mgnify:CR=1 FL=1
MQCNFCEWRCNLADKKHGVCRMYREEAGAVKERFPHKWCTYGTSRIESLPFYHVYPGSRSMTIGTTGCNMDCRYCSNAYVAKEDPGKIQETIYEFTPRELVRMAEKLGCHNIVFNVNEPTMSLPSLAEVGREAQKAGIPMGCLTNAYMTEEATALMAEIFSFFNISLKGLNTGFCRDYLGIPGIGPVLRNIRRLAETSHVEITTPVIQGVNDHEIDEFATFIADVDREIPWHVFRLLPEYKMKENAYPSVEAINRALEKNRRVLSYIYFHNFIGSDWVNTLCPQCGALVIERFSLGCGGDKMGGFYCRDNKCPQCGYAIKMCGGWTDWHAKEGAR